VWTLFTRTNTKKAPDLWKHCARGGTRTGFHPLQTLDSRRNIRNPGQSGTGTAQSAAQSVDTVHTPVLPTRGLTQTAAPPLDRVRRFFVLKNSILLEKYNRRLQPGPARARCRVSGTQHGTISLWTLHHHVTSLQAIHDPIGALLHDRETPLHTLTTD
jgi:hypothetical protein